MVLARSRQALRLTEDWRRRAETQPTSRARTPADHHALKRSSSTLLTRLALALLAVLGFVAPLSAPEGDRVVQTAGGKPSPVVRPEVVRAAVAGPLASAEAPLPSCTVLASSRAGEPARRYLLHRAWLV